ncbi:MAG: hypothetical protein HYU55_06240 [Nocardioides sp.]|nr:hypothetical protein [Nocardioides sp.]
MRQAKRVLQLAGLAELTEPEDVLVEAHGGEVRYEASRGGARFVVTLPAVERPPSPGTRPARGPGEHAVEPVRRTVDG